MNLRSWPLLLGLLTSLALLPACRCAPQESGVTLDQAAETTTIKTLDSLGPHRMQADIQRKKRNEGAVVEQSDEQLLIVWQDWDNFRIRRVRDSKVVEHVLVVKGNPYTLGPEGRLAPTDDAEPYRGELRLSWDPWEQAMDPFLERLKLDSPVPETLEGRGVTNYTVTLAPRSELEKKTPKTLDKGFLPTVMAGNVWVDQATALRLKADLNGRWTVGPDSLIENEITLRMSRGQFGELQDLRPPGELTLGTSSRVKRIPLGPEGEPRRAGKRGKSRRRPAVP